MGISIQSMHSGTVKPQHVHNDTSPRRGLLGDGPNSPLVRLARDIGKTTSDNSSLRRGILGDGPNSPLVRVVSKIAQTTTPTLGSTPASQGEDQDFRKEALKTIRRLYEMIVCTNRPLTQLTRKGLQVCMGNQAFIRDEMKNVVRCWNRIYAQIIKDPKAAEAFFRPTVEEVHRGVLTISLTLLFQSMQNRKIELRKID